MPEKFQEAAHAFSAIGQAIMFAAVGIAIGVGQLLASKEKLTPRRGEYTFSNRLRRLQYNNDWRGKLARPVVKYLNWVSPGHI